MLDCKHSFCHGELEEATQRAIKRALLFIREIHKREQNVVS